MSVWFAGAARKPDTQPSAPHDHYKLHLVGYVYDCPHFMRLINARNMDHIRFNVLLRRGIEWGLAIRGLPTVWAPTRLDNRPFPYN